MKKALVALAVALVAVAGLVASIEIASEAGGEVVVIRSVDESGAELTTRLWVVDDGGFPWLRAGSGASAWFARLEANPVIVFERGGRAERRRAVAVRDPVVRDRIEVLMAEKYGLADRWIDVIRDASDSVPIRLEPLADPSS